MREHHVKPDEIFSFRFATDSGMLSWFGGSGAFVLLVLSRLVGDRRPWWWRCAWPPWSTASTFR